MNWLQQRQREAEIQDEPGLDDALLIGALEGLRRINFWSRSHRTLWSPICALARAAGASRLSVLDVASGAGDIPIALWQRARRAGLDLNIVGCDLNPRTVAFAQELAAKKKADVKFTCWDVLQEDFPRRYDVATCSLFLHHLSDEDAVLVLGRMARAAERMVLVNDLLRGVRGLVLAYLGTRLFSMSPVNRVDSLRSVRAAFTMQEARALAQKADLTGAALKKKWPCRFLLTWQRG